MKPMPCPGLTLTIGPASRETPILRELAKIADRFRINTAFTNRQELTRLLDQITTLAEEVNQDLRVVLDLQGAKMRIGACPAVERLPDEVRLVPAAAADEEGVLPVPHPALFDAVRVGDRLLCNDARVDLEVIAVSAQLFEARVLRNGPLAAHKGINRVHHPIPFSGLGIADQEAIAAGRDFPRIELACSFVYDGSEAIHLRTHWQGPLIAKIERPEAFPHLKPVARAFDELWLCRGDLGAQAGLEGLGPLQRELAHVIPDLGKPVFLAGQVLQYMTHFPQPTRAEVVQLSCALHSGFSGVVLSDETAVGKHPLAAARMAARLLRAGNRCSGA